MVIENAETSREAQSVEHEYTRKEILSMKPMASTEVPEAVAASLEAPPATAQSSSDKRGAYHRRVAGFPHRAPIGRHRQNPDQWALSKSPGSEAEVFDRG